MRRPKRKGPEGPFDLELSPYHPAALDAFSDDPPTNSLDLGFPPADPARRPETAITRAILDLDQAGVCIQSSFRRERNCLRSSATQTNERSHRNGSKTNFTESHSNPCCLF
jgi:hypothetical protein